MPHFLLKNKPGYLILAFKKEDASYIGMFFQ